MIFLFPCFSFNTEVAAWQWQGTFVITLSLSLSLSLYAILHTVLPLSLTDIWQYSSCRVSKCNIHWSDDLTDNFTVYHSWRGYSHIFYTTDRERIFYTQDLKSDCGFDDECIFLKVRLWQFWNAWSTSVNPRDIFSHISPEKFLVIFLLSLNPWHLLTVLTADWDTPHHTTPHHTTPDEDRECYFTQNIWLDCSLVIALLGHLNQKTIDTGKCQQQLAAGWWTTSTSTTRILDLTWDRRGRKLPCYYFKYNFQTRPDFKWIRAKFLRLVMGINIAWFTFIFTQRNQDILSFPPPPFSLSISWESSFRGAISSNLLYQSWDWQTERMWCWVLWSQSHLWSASW